MAIDQESFNKQLYDLLKMRGYKPVPKNNKNENVSTPQEAHVFEFTFKKGDEEYGKAWATIDEAQSVVVYFDSEQAESPEGKTPGVAYDDSWSGFLEHLKTWAQRKQLNFDLSNKDRLGDDMRQREYWKMKQKIEEGYHPMGKQASYNDSIPTVKIILQHTRQVQEGEQRFRNVAKIFLETQEGERFLAPTTRPGIAQVYARHLAEGGEPHDERWNHIKSLCEEYNKMAGFVRATRSNEFSESVQPLVNEGINHYNKLRESLGKLRSHRGYNAYFESWTPALMEEESDDSIAEMFVEETLDPRIESVMPILSRLQRTLPEMQQMPEVQQLEEWSSKIITDAILNESATSVYYPKREPIDVDLHELRRIDNPGDIKDEEFLKQIKQEGYSVLEHPETFKVYFYDTVGDFIDSEHDSISDAIEYAKKNIYDYSLGEGEVVSLSESEDDLYDIARTFDMAISDGFMSKDDILDIVDEDGKYDRKLLSKALDMYLDAMNKVYPRSLNYKKGVGILKKAGLGEVEVGEDIANENQGPSGVGLDTATARQMKKDAEELYKKEQERERREWEEFTKGEEDIEEDLDANQKRVGQLGPYEKVGSKGAVGKLVGESQIDELEELKRFL